MDNLANAIAVLFLLHFCWSYYWNCYRKGYTIDLWHYSLLNTLFIIHVMLPFARSNLNIFALGWLLQRTQGHVNEAYFISAFGYFFILVGWGAVESKPWHGAAQQCCPCSRAACARDPSADELPVAAARAYRGDPDFVDRDPGLLLEHGRLRLQSPRLVAGGDVAASYRPVYGVLCHYRGWLHAGTLLHLQRTVDAGGLPAADCLAGVLGRTKQFGVR